MFWRRNQSWLPDSLRTFASFALIAVLLTFFLSGCRSRGHTSDSRLKKIDELLAAQLPRGVTRGRVEYFLNSRGYRIESSSNKNEVVAIVRQIDTETLQPAAARVTFHFDSNNNLLSYDLRAAQDAPSRP